MSGLLGCAHARFLGAVVAGLAFFSGVASFFLVMTIRLQVGLGFSPLHTALTFLRGSETLVSTRAVDVGHAMRS